MMKLVKHTLPQVMQGKVCIIINVGDHQKLLTQIQNELKNFIKYITLHSDNFNMTQNFCKTDCLNDNLNGIHIFYHKDIFAAVYSTNILMRQIDVLITKPSELAFYPIPKLLVKRVGGHEAYGALRSNEIGDGTVECRHTVQAIKMLNLLVCQKDGIISMCENIQRANEMHVYDGGYNAVLSAIALKENQSQKQRPI